MALLIDTMAKGRFRGFGLMLIRDVFGVSCYVDTLARYILENIKEFTSTSNICYKDKLELFAKTIDPKNGNPFNLIN